MANNLVGDVYLKVIEEVINASSTDFEESGVSQSTLQEMQQTWQTKLSARQVATMPWDPKPEPTPAPRPAMPVATSNGLPPSSYPTYDTPPSAATSNGPRIKAEPGVEPQYNGLTNGYPQGTGPTQGGLARAQHLLQQQYGPNASASLNAMQRAGAGGGLALPGQHTQRDVKPQGLHLPGQSSPPMQPQYSPEHQQAMLRHQQQMQQQQNQVRIKVENESPQLGQGAFPPQPVQPNYSQTDGADDATEQWQGMLAQYRSVSAEERQKADSMVRDRVLQHSRELGSGLMVPLDEQPSIKRRKRQPQARQSSAQTSAGPSIPQLDGDYEEEEEKPNVKEEDDEDAINSDLDDDDDDGGNMGDDDDEFTDQILCTYDKVQRVKNKWKCTLKDGIMSTGGKEWVFHKGQGEFEW